MKKLLLLLTLIFICPITVFAVDANTPVGNDVGYNACMYFQSQVYHASGQGYVGRCYFTGCASGVVTYTGEVMWGYEIVSCENGNNTPYYKNVKNGCPKEGSSCTPTSVTKYCTAVDIYDCDKNRDGTVYIAPGSGGGGVSEESNNYLKSLSISPGSISFNKNTIYYYAEVPKGTTNVTVKAVAETSKATITISNNRNISEKKPILVTVVAANGSIRTYSIYLTFKGGSGTTTTKKPTKDTDNYLSSLELSEGTINFKKDVTEYEIVIDKKVTNIDVVATPSSNKASVKINNNDKFNENTPITIVVTAENGQTKTYTIKIKYKESLLDNNNYLKELTVSPGKIVFDKETTTYTITVEKGTKDIEVVAKPESEKAKVEVINNKDISDIKPISVTVTAEDGSVRTYVIGVKYEIDEGSNNLIKSISIDGYSSFAKKFNSNVNDYTLKIKKNENRLNINIELENEDAEYIILGNSNLKNKSKIKIVVTSPNGEENTYSILITKPTNLVLYIFIALVVGVGGVFAFKVLKSVIPGKRDDNYDYE